MSNLKRTPLNRTMKLVTITAIFLLLFSLGGCSSNKQEVNSSPNNAPRLTDQAMEAYYVDAQWLQENLDQVTIVDARADKEYKKGHIPGAVNITWQALSNMQPKQGEPGWGVVLSNEQLSKKLGEFGIDGKKDIVVYNDPAGLGEDGRVVWMLRIAGLENSRMLFGGWPAWQKAGGEGTKDTPQVKAVSFSITNPDTSLLATTEYIKTNKDKVKLLDTRSPEEFTGKTDHGERVRGHIPGAIHLHYRDAFNPDGTVKTVAELKDMFVQAGLKPGDEVISYCTVGIRSGFMTELLRMCGYENAKNYNASFSEWAGDPNNPIEK